MSLGSSTGGIAGRPLLVLAVTVGVSADVVGASDGVAAGWPPDDDEHAAHAASRSTIDVLASSMRSFRIIRATSMSSSAADRGYADRPTVQASRRRFPG